MKVVEKVLKLANEEIGYLEKASNVRLDDKKTNAGKNNYTKYARDLYPELQGQPWCDIFFDWLFVKCFGKINAKKMIGGFSAYTPTSANYYKKKGRWFNLPKVGDQIFFKNDVRINHTGIVVAVDKDTVYTIEGNTSDSKEIVANGGAVCKKSYKLDNPRIAGFGRPDWSVIENTEYNLGWNKDSKGWWYADTKNSYLKGTWKNINGHRYLFDENGYAVSGWYTVGNEKYFFEDRKGHELECALYVTDDKGVQKIGEF